jgi:hypothetical protein
VRLPPPRHLSLSRVSSLPFRKPPSMLSGASVRRLTPFLSQNGSIPIDGCRLP